MNDYQPGSEPEDPVAAALRQEPESWTPACLPPEQVIALAERSLPEREATRLMAHVALCGRCRREYAETGDLLSLSDEVRDLEGRGAAPAGDPAPQPAAARAAPRPFWQGWLRPGVGFALGAAAAALVVYLTVAAPALERHERLASTLGEREAARARLEQELADARRRNEGESSRAAEEARRLEARLKEQGTRMARLERDSAALRQLPLPAPEWLLSGGGIVRGGGGTDASPEIALVRPADTAVASPSPALEFRPVPGGAGYEVSLEMADSTEETPPLRQLGPGRWQVTRPLPPGRVYQWAVTARRKDATLRSPLTRFYVLSDAERAELEKARKEHAENPLALAALYARLGLAAEAEEQLRAALKADPEQPVARRWLEELARRRGR